MIDNKIAFCIDRLAGNHVGNSYLRFMPGLEQRAYMISENWKKNEIIIKVVEKYLQKHGLICMRNRGHIRALRKRIINEAYSKPYQKKLKKLNLVFDWPSYEIQHKN